MITYIFKKLWSRLIKRSASITEKATTNSPFLGTTVSFMHDIEKYKFFHISNIRERSWRNCNSVNELDLWCIENNCFYGWSSYFYSYNKNPWYPHYVMFIVTNNEDSYTLAKLTW